MSISKILTVCALAFLIINPLDALAQDRPIVLITSGNKTPPAAGPNRISIGYWDVDDFDGNGGHSKWSIFNPKFDSSIRFASRGTCRRLGQDHYMATLAINPRTLGQIKNLRLIADYDPGLLKNYVQNEYGNCTIVEDNSRNNYLVGWWDVDGGGGGGSDGSSGSRYMAFLAELGSSPSDRKLLDLQLIASSEKTPTFKVGYVMVGFWDVDKGGSRGTDGSTGSYMMTLLAKWDK